LNYRADITITETLIFVLLQYYTKHIYTRGTKTKRKHILLKYNGHLMAIASRKI